jgi:hypothetical protein
MYIEKTNVSKSPEGMLKAELVNYYGLSAAEADILWERLENFVKEHFENCIFDNQTIRYAVSAAEPAGKPIKYCRLVPVKITLSKPSDKKIREESDPSHLREVLILRFTNESYRQGGLLSREDLSEILFVSTRTIKRAIKRLKVKGMDIPTRGLVKDIGPTISHKASIVELALKRYKATEIAFKTRHSLSSIARYVENFIKVVYLFEKDFPLDKISRVTKISEKVAVQYKSLYQKYLKDCSLKERLGELSGYIGPKKRGQKMTKGSASKQIYGPLQQKTLKNELIRYLIENYGFDSKPKIASAIVDDFISIYEDRMKDKERLAPGQILWPAVKKEERHGNGKTLARTTQRAVILTLVSASDLSDLADSVPLKEVTKKRIVRVIEEAFSQGGVLALSDVAVIFSKSTGRVSQLISEYQKEKDTVIPYRGNFHDIGRTVTHKAKIVSMHLKGCQTIEIARATKHAPGCVDRYLADFDRVKMLSKQGISVSEIAYLTSLSESLVYEYIHIIKEQLPDFYQAYCVNSNTIKPSD